jgi:hypothetical protein
LMSPNSVGFSEEAGFGVVPPVSPVGDASRPTPIPAVNVTTSAKTTTAPMAAHRLPRPAADDVGAWEGPGVREVASGGSWSEVGWVGIRSVSIGCIVLVR